MSSEWLTLFLLALAAGFVPMLFAFETYELSKEDGLKRGLAFFSGVTLFRIALIVALGILFTGLLTTVSNLFSGISTDTSKLFDQLGQDVRSGQHLLFDGALILAGIALLIEAYRHWTNRSGVVREQRSGKPANGKARSISGLIVFGFSWMLVSVNQWLFMTAAIGQILSLSNQSTSRTLISLLFLLISSLILLIPLVFTIVRPKSAQRDLGKIEIRMHESMPYIVVVVLIGTGLYFIVDGISGELSFIDSG